MCTWRAVVSVAVVVVWQSLHNVNMHVLIAAVNTAVIKEGAPQLVDPHLLFVCFHI